MHAHLTITVYDLALPICCLRKRNKIQHINAGSKGGKEHSWLLACCWATEQPVLREFSNSLSMWLGAGCIKPDARAQPEKGAIREGTLQPSPISCSIKGLAAAIGGKHGGRSQHPDGGGIQSDECRRRHDTPRPPLPQQRGPQGDGGEG